MLKNTEVLGESVVFVNCYLNVCIELIVGQRLSAKTCEAISSSSTSCCLRRLKHANACESTFLRTFSSAWKKKIIAFWLILPVVTCLSQRLSHACLSTESKTIETANGSLNQL